MNSFGVIVDGYSTGAGFAQEFLKYGILCIHVQSQSNVPRVYSHTYVPSDYHSHYIFEDDLTSLAQKLAQYKPQFVIPGAECGIELADQLCEKLNLPGNTTNLSAHRRNKYLMYEVVKSKGLQVIPTIKVTTIEEAEVWASTQEAWPLIVKPLTSAGGEGVKICYSVADVKTAYLEIMEKRTNMLGFENQAVLIQHYILGEEYVVNTVSHAGKHKFCELWDYTRYNVGQGHQIYDTAKIINVETQKHRNAIDYAIKVIDALGIQYGPAHIEVIVNEKGCYLVEIGARLMGANLPFSLLAKSVTTPQAIFTVMAYAAPEKFYESFTTPYYITQNLVALFMVSSIAGIIKEIDFLDEIRSLKSFYDMKLSVNIGGKLKRTIDYQTSPGMIYLSHEDSNMIATDRIYIRELEKRMFQLENQSLTLETLEQKGQNLLNKNEIPEEGIEIYELA